MKSLQKRSESRCVLASPSQSLCSQFAAPLFRVISNWISIVCILFCAFVRPLHLLLPLPNLFACFESPVPPHTGPLGDSSRYPERARLILNVMIWPQLSAALPSPRKQTGWLMLLAPFPSFGWSSQPRFLQFILIQAILFSVLCLARALCASLLFPTSVRDKALSSRSLFLPLALTRCAVWPRSCGGKRGASAPGEGTGTSAVTQGQRGSAAWVGVCFPVAASVLCVLCLYVHVASVCPPPSSHRRMCLLPSSPPRLCESPRVCVSMFALRVCCLCCALADAFLSFFLFFPLLSPVFLALFWLCAACLPGLLHPARKQCSRSPH